MIIAYKKSLENFHEITHAISIQMKECYNDIGKATITLPIDDYNVSAIENGGIIYDTVRDMSFIIQSHKYDTTKNTITVNAYTCNCILDKRAILNKTEISNIENGVYDIIENNLRGLENIAIAERKGLEDIVETTLYGGQILESIMPILEVAKIGNRMRWNPDSRTHIFELYKGNDLTSGIHAVVFSDEYKTAKDLVISEDDSVFKNYFYVLGTLNNDAETQIVVEVGSATGNDRFEKWISRTLRQGGDETEAQFISRLRQAGQEEAAKLVKRNTFSVVVDTNEYGKTYKLGDVVSCVSQRFGVELTSRITSVEYILDINGEKINLTLGEPTLTAIGEVKLNA